MFTPTQSASLITPPILYFRSTLMHNGYRRPLPARVEKFLRHDGAILAAVLRSETPLSVSDIAIACQEYAVEHPETVCSETGITEQERCGETAVVPDEHTLPTLLTRFVFFGLAEAVPQSRCQTRCSTD